VAQGQDAVLRVIFADDSEWQARDGAPIVTIRYKTRAAEARTVLFGYVGLFEAHFYGEVEIIGADAVAEGAISIEKCLSPSGRSICPTKSALRSCAKIATECSTRQAYRPVPSASPAPEADNSRRTQEITLMLKAGLIPSP